MKPIIAAVSGGAYGGGVEILLNCDYVVASEGAKFGLPEVKRGVVAIQGGKLLVYDVLSSLYLERLSTRHSKISTHRRTPRTLFNSGIALELALSECTRIPNGF